MLVAASLPIWADNSVTVNYNGNTATVTVDENVSQYLTVTQSGAHVSIEQSSEVAEEITYTLTGTSNDGEFYMTGSYKATVELNGLTLTNTNPVYSGAAVHIQNGKRINVKVMTGTTNTLTDAANGEQKGCLYIKGHAEFKQQGTLNIVGNTKHGIKAGEYITIKNATININAAVGDGISCNQYFLMESGIVNINGTSDDGIQCDLDGTTSTGITTNHEDEDSGNMYISGGTITIHCAANATKGLNSVGDIYITDTPVLNITMSGNGVWDTTDLEAKASSGISADGNINISGGTITVISTGSGGKGMKCDNVMTISGGDITVETSGGLYYNNGTTENLNYTYNTEQVNDSYYCSAKGIKAGTKTTSGNSTSYAGGLEISGGTVTVTTSGNNAEGIESKNYLNITGGQVTVDAHDDAINSAQDMTITNGYVYARSSNNDGMDANGDMFIQGGLVYAVGASSPEVAIDANSEENKKFYFSGGVLITIGGLEQGSDLSQTCYQSSSWSPNTWYSLIYDNTVIAFLTPTSGGSPLVVSTPSSSSPTVRGNVTVSGGTSILNGKCYLDAETSGGSNVSLSQYTSGGGGGTPPGPGNSYTISASANPTAGGTVSGAGTYSRGATCTLIATPNTGYTFTNWTRNGQQVSTNATYSFTVNGNASYVANFSLNTYTVSATANPAAGGSITGTGTYSHGSTVTLTATANENYVFVNWVENGAVVSTEATYVFTITGNRTLSAIFEENNPIPEEGPYLVVESYTPDAALVNQETPLSLNVKNLGVDPTEDRVAVNLYCVDERLTIFNNSTELDMLEAGETVAIEDVFSFVIAEGTPNNTQFQITVEMTSVNETWNRTIVVSAIGDTCMLHFTLSDSYGDGWNDAALTVSFNDGTASQTLTMSSGSTASYEVEVNNGTHVTLTWKKGRYDSECSFTTSYDGDLVIYQLTQGANPSAGVLYEFDCNCAIASQTFVVNVSANNPAHGSVSGGGEFSYGQSCTLTATASEGFVFVGWMENGEVVSGANPYTFSVTSDCDLVANFIQAIEIGTDETTNNYLPSYNYYKYSLTQQIYTAEEIGTAGTITSIAFYNAGAEKTRTYDFYLKATDKDSFSSKTDWIAVEASDKVFSGEVTLSANAWTFISFSTPFEYDGTSNIVLVTDDNSGAYTNSPHMACSVFSTSVSQAIYYWNDNTDFNPLAPPTSSGSSSGWGGNPNDVLSVKNHILLSMETEEPSVEQTLELVAGWNWVSVNVEITLDDLKAAILAADAGASPVIKSKNNGQTTFNGVVWVGGLKSIDLSQMYEIKVANACSIMLEGVLVNPEDHPATIKNGANWIAYPLTEIQTVTNVFSGFPTEGDNIKSKTGGQAAWNGVIWTGALKRLEPGKGYIYTSTAADDRTFVFPASK